MTLKIFITTFTTADAERKAAELTQSEALADGSWTYTARPLKSLPGRACIEVRDDNKALLAYYRR